MALFKYQPKFLASLCLTWDIHYWLLLMVPFLLSFPSNCAVSPSYFQSSSIHCSLFRLVFSSFHSYFWKIISISSSTETAFFLPIIVIAFSISSLPMMILSYVYVLSLCLLKLLAKWRLIHYWFSFCMSSSCLTNLTSSHFILPSLASI